MTVSKELIEDIKYLKKAINEVSVYDLNTYSTMELYYSIANKLNEVIKELSRFEGVVSDEVIEQNEKLLYLLGEGLTTEVVKKINQMVLDGTMDTIINHNLFNGLNSKIDTFKQEVSEQFNTKANEIDLNIERQRINSLTKLSEGSTTGDAELIDARIGADGFEYENVGSSIRSQFKTIHNILDLAIIKKSSNLINSLNVKNKKFQDVFPNSNKVYFPLGEYMSIKNNSKIMGRVIFTDNTYVNADGVWYACDDTDRVILTGGINVVKTITSEAENITKIGFYFGSSSRPNYVDKVIKNIMFIEYIDGGSNPIEDYYVEFGSEKINEINAELIVIKEDINAVKDNISVSNDLICEWYNESQYIIAQGLELNIYYDTICRTNSNLNVYFKVETSASSDFCNTLDRCLRFKTNATVGDYAVTVSCLEKGSNKVLGTTNFTVKVVENNVLSVAKKSMFIGDSLSDAGIITRTVKELGGTNLKLYGVRGSGDNLHEGRSGWKCSTYLYSETYESKTNAFYNSNKVGSIKFDFTYYMQNNSSFSDVEFVTIFLGRNDTYNGANLVGNLQNMIADIHSYNPNIVISVVLPYFTPRQSNEWGAIRKSNAEELYQASFVGYKNFKDGLSGLTNVYLIPLGVNLDIVNDFPYTQKSVSNRNTKTEGVYTDIIHPLECGYQKLADVWYSWFINYVNTH